jgi:uncharacterized protein (TIRG00374 family)
VKVLNTILFALGIGLLAGLIWSVGVGELWRQLGLLGWGLIPFVMGEGIAEMIHTLGWRHCLTGKARSLSWFLLYRIRMAGYAINYLTPTAALGGELSKAALLASRCRGRQAASGVLVGKVCFGLAHLVFVTIGTFVIMRVVRLPLVVWLSLFLSGALVAFGIITFLLLQKYGKLGAVIRWFVARGFGGRSLEKISSNISAVDDELRTFHREHPVDMCLAICWHLLGYSVGIVQTWLFLQLLHPSASIPVAAAIWFLGMWFDLLTFAVPMNAGSLEGSRILSLRFLGYGSLLGMTYGIAIRLAQMFWSAVGLAFYGALTARESRRQSSPPISEVNLDFTTTYKKQNNQTLE